MNRIKTLLLVFLFVNYGFAQVGSEYISKNDWEKFGLKGNVKTVKTALKITENDLWNSDLFYKYNPVLHNYYATDEYDDELFYKKFNSYGVMTEYSSKTISNLSEELESGEIFKYQIDSLDFSNKQKMAVQYNFAFGINPNKVRVFDEKSRVVEKYEYKTENQKITEEVYFDDYISDESPADEIAKFDIRTLFFYNPDGLLVKKQIIIPEDEYNDNSTKTYYDQQIYNGNTLNYHYLYNEKNQLVKMTIYKKNKFLYQESYNIENDKVIEMEKLVDSEKTHNEFDTNKAIYKYDSFGNVTDLTYYDNDTGDEIITSIKFDYTLDSAKNWISCKMYLNKKSEIPTAVAERKIEYFKN